MSQVISAERVGKKVRVMLGDETGVVKGFIYDSEELKAGNTVALFNLEAAVIKEHIELQLIEARKKVERLEKMKERRNSLHDEEEQKSSMLNENTIMRKELKVLNEGLSQLIELMHDLRLKKKERREIPVEDRKKARE